MLLNLTENEFVFLREVFCGLEYAENAFVAGALSRTPLGSSQHSPRPSSQLGRAHPSPDPPHSTPRPSCLWRWGLPPIHIISGCTTGLQGAQGLIQLHPWSICMYCRVCAWWLCPAVSHWSSMFSWTEVIISAKQHFNFVWKSQLEHIRKCQRLGLQAVVGIWQHILVWTNVFCNELEQE